MSAYSEAKMALSKAQCDMHTAMQNLTLEEVHEAIENGGYTDRYVSATFDMCTTGMRGEVQYKYTVRYLNDDSDYENGRIWITRQGSRIVADY